MVAIKTLVKTAVYVGIGGISAALIMKMKLEEQVRGQAYYKESMKVLRSHPGAITLLGEPIKDLGFDFGVESQKYGQGKITGFAVPVKGSNQRGKYYFWADHAEDKWIITRAELELDKEPDRRLVIRKME
ncbi:uncharacterized protein LOC131438425 [Malaya genurostris]|uniref:uncharacterized protein LOC131438425 n=1 Tax=Malaya genurostris TaxID=325434 RepID=UPI0026F3FA63|nr:uncharacterized protein LOC131438425 [Malaya genurostris]